MGVIFSGMLGAILAILSTVVVQFAKARFDELGERCDEISSAALSAADLSSAYWLKAPTERSEAHALEEAKLLGLQERINGMVVAVLPRLNSPMHAAVQDGLAALVDAISGGAFRVVPREPDADRVIAVQSAAAALIVALRVAHARRLTMRGMIAWPDFRREEEDRWL